MKTKLILHTLILAVACIFTAPATISAQSPSPSSGKKPNILVIMGDDIGWFNPSCYNRGMMGFQTPNIDCIAKEGAMFMTWYAQQSCTAGRAAFITGQQPIRTGLTKVGMPGGMSACARKT
jgi:arylsulfatase